MEDNKLAQCDACRKLVPLTDVKYVLKAHRSFPILVCSACRSDKAIDDSKREVKRKEIKGVDNPQKAVYVCYSCKYRFKHNPQAVADPKCPMCGKVEHVSKYTRVLAEDLLRECD